MDALRSTARGLRNPVATCRPGPKRGVACNAALKIQVQQEVGFGDKIKVVGNHSVMGDWNAEAGAELQWSDGNVWRGTIEVPNDTNLEFKIVKLTGHGDQNWEECSNRQVHVTQDESIKLEWGNPETRKVDESSGNSSASNGTSHGDSNGAPSHSNPPPSTEQSDMHTAWRGKDVQFMQGNNHSGDRQGAWSTNGLDGALLEFVKGDEHAASWLKKLDVAKRLVVDTSPDMRPSLDTLAPLYIYLQWITTGSIQCAEGGGHFRPNRHAELSRIMFRSLEWVNGDNKKTQVERMIARKITSKLPSFSEAFTASVPLTRIRDIAHRNDIPHDLKQQIKHTLQNKLHRNAGPEDLVATELMLQKITAPGTDYSHDFVEQFKVFTAELRDFFNASSLTDMLQSMTNNMDHSAASTVQRFLDTKAKVDSAGDSAGLNDIIDIMHQLTSVRCLLMRGLSSGLRNDAPDSALSQRQKWRLAEIRCEEYMFVISSRVLNIVEGQGGSRFLASAHEKEWAQPLGAAVLAVRHCGLSGWKPTECMAVEDELAAWLQLGLAKTRDDTMRLKASLERVKRLTDEFADVMLETFAERAQKMGRGLGMPSEVQDVFTEAEIRSSIVFQLSKMVTLLLTATREILGDGDFDPLVMGRAVGELVAVDRIEPGMNLAGGRPCVLLVNQADGDEEVSAAGKNIVGVILCQDLPHLSHLGVRARQSRVAFITCTDDAVISTAITPLIGENVLLVSNPSGTSVSVAKEGDHSSASTEDSGTSSGTSAQASPVNKVTKPTVLTLSTATVETSGSKAASCAILSSVSKDADAGAEFSAAAGGVLPFGCMEVAIAAAGQQQWYFELLGKMETCEVGSMQALCNEMRNVIMQCRPDAESLKQLRLELSGSVTAIARSSANVEDLEGLSGAGLYDSIPNLLVESDDSLAAGISEVWASLYTRRAVLSRRAAGIPQSSACMAVLVQEMITPDTCFVLHTWDPMTAADGDKDKASLFAEVAPGMGEILASGTAGSAYRFSVDKASGKVVTRAFANFSEAYLPTGAKQRAALGESIYSSSTDGNGAAPAGTIAKRCVNYSQQKLSTSEEARVELAGRLSKVGQYLETVFDGPQDVEGALLGQQLYIVQARPQP